MENYPACMASATRPNQNSDWKKQFMDAVPTLFEALQAYFHFG